MRARAARLPLEGAKPPVPPTIVPQASPTGTRVGQARRRHGVASMRARAAPLRLARRVAEEVRWRTPRKSTLMTKAVTGIAQAQWLSHRCADRRRTAHGPTLEPRLGASVVNLPRWHAFCQQTMTSFIAHSTCSL